MLKNRFMAAGIAFLLLSLLILPFAIGSRGRRGRSQNITRNVVLAKQTIPPRKIITAEMVEIRSVDPRTRDIAGDALSKVEDAIGKVSDTEILPSRPIARGQLKDLKSMGAAARVPPGKRAMSIQVTDASAAAGFVRPLDRVDVLGTFPSTDGGSGITQTLLQSVEVIAVGKTLDEQALNATNGANLVTVAVTPQEARWLASAQTRASLHLVLRPVDEQNASTDGEQAPPAFLTPVRLRPHRPTTTPPKRSPTRVVETPSRQVPRLWVPPAPAPLVTPLHTPPALRPAEGGGSAPLAALAPPPQAPTSQSVDLIVGTRRTNVSVPLTATPPDRPSPDRGPGPDRPGE